MDEPAAIARIARGVGDVPAAHWDALAGAEDPFLSHAFLSILEQSGSVGPGTGWQAAPILIDGPDGAPVAATPAYIKGHSQGEYVFDHNWADAWRRAGGQYYPKLQIAVPFTPVPGRRLLTRAGPDALDHAAALIGAAQAVVDQNNLSSAHATFVVPDQIALFEAAGWLIREGSQFHWENRGYRTFDDFLAALSSAKRKSIRKERARACDGLHIDWITGDALSESHWDAFWTFYQDTGARKWGTPYLTRSFFSALGERMADKVLLILAHRDGRPIAGALNLIGADALYGRYWGCVEDVPNLHFELCYYQAIDYALAHGLRRVEAGAQGGHKLVRGYEPVATWSAHYIADPGFRAAIADFLAAERAAVADERAFLEERTPFRKG